MHYDVGNGLDLGKLGGELGAREVGLSRVNDFQHELAPHQKRIADILAFPERNRGVSHDCKWSALQEREQSKTGEELIREGRC